MKKTDILIGFIAGIFTALLGSWLFVVVFTDGESNDGLEAMRAFGQLGKIITLGAVLNLILFFAFLHFRKELMARGVIIATILLAILTIFI